MKFIVSRNVLYKNLSAISGVLGSNSTMAILDCFLFTVNGDQLTVTASDLDSRMSAVIELSNVEGEGSVAIPSKILLETLKLIPETPIVFVIDTEKQFIKFTAASGEYDSPCYSADEYPQIKEFESVKSFEIDSNILQKAIGNTIFAAGNDELRPTMMGILCELSADGITFVTTDAHKMVRYQNSNVKSDDFISFILPKKPMAHLKNILTGLNETIKVEYAEEINYIQFSFSNITLLSLLKEGKYPNYEAVIPQDNPNKLTVVRDDFLKSIRRVGIFSNQSTFQVRISLSEEGVTITAEDIDFSNKAEESLAGQYEGETMDIGFNSRFLREMVENLNYNEIRLEMSQPNRAALILPGDKQEEGENLLMLIMPIILNY
ncbi:MAG TPA: DNA polymerase III subunit beta [Bacteroidales bacterium]|jgi:DNA polymerase-3 subunit beta|nr:DNA polymerase III subunit beta [Bacteroidales bacterium]HOF45777.1 DNA polymerase III subunit beta [Bacteroidales bacterium]HOS57669.1 DNA polymerase III subunit beta [Bacteroidales bacterium]HPY81619.1 DNA polymerase III subunit beta [Bacteroidales bacterium]HQA87214.1 DNA polymerase III subunit beta [Bacteroidales bacterium]